MLKLIGGGKWAAPPVSWSSCWAPVLSWVVQGVAIAGTIASPPRMWFRDSARTTRRLFSQVSKVRPTVLGNLLAVAIFLPIILVSVVDDGGLRLTMAGVSALAQTWAR